jgi:hypothetical protein
LVKEGPLKGPYLIKGNFMEFEFIDNVKKHISCSQDLIAYVRYLIRRYSEEKNENNKGMIVFDIRSALCDLNTEIKCLDIDCECHRKTKLFMGEQWKRQ